MKKIFLLLTIVLVNFNAIYSTTYTEPQGTIIFNGNLNTTYADHYINISGSPNIKVKITLDLNSADCYANAWVYIRDVMYNDFGFDEYLQDSSTLHLVDSAYLSSPMYLSFGFDTYDDNSNCVIKVEYLIPESEPLLLGDNWKISENLGKLDFTSKDANGNFLSQNSISFQNSSSWIQILSGKTFYLNQDLLLATGKAFSSNNSDLIFKTNTTERMRIAYSNGNVGIGTNNPTDKLTVNGRIRCNDRIVMNQPNAMLYMTSSSTDNTYYTRYFHAGNLHTYIDYSDNMYFRPYAGGNCSLILQGDGNVAIGFNYDYSNKSRPSNGSKLSVNGGVTILGNNPNGSSLSVSGRIESGNIYASDFMGIGTTIVPTGYKLAVDGRITANEIVINDPLVDYTADFVFDELYELRSLGELEQFVKENKHLPDVPSATEMKETGIGLAEMNKLLLQKIEELTLYMIEQQKSIQQQQAQIDALRSAVEATKQ